MKMRQVFLIIFVIGAFGSCNKSADVKDSSLKKLDQTIEVIVFPTFSLKIINYCLETNEEQVDFFFIKNNLLPENKSYTADQDGDGLSDQFETGYTFKLPLNPADPNSVVKGDSGPAVRDLILVLLGLKDNEASELPCTTSHDQDTDQDGLNDCEELLIGTDKSKWDSDGDSIPDEVELRAGLNPNFKDALIDTDGDGYHNLFEVKKGSAIDSETSFETQDLTLSSRQKSLYETIGLQEKENNCYEVQITNIPYLAHLNQNLFSLYFITKVSGETKLKKKISLSVLTEAIKHQGALIYNYQDSNFEEQESEE